MPLTFASHPVAAADVRSEPEVVAQARPLPPRVMSQLGNGKSAYEGDGFIGYVPASSE